MKPEPERVAAQSGSGAGRAAAVEPRFFQLIPANPNIDFIGLRGRMLIVSWILIGIGLASV